jgi:hypothetical protein
MQSEDTCIRLSRAYPSQLRPDLETVLQIIPADERSAGELLPVKVGEETLHIPVRVYFEDPDETLISTLTSTQKAILGTLYTRHNNGFVREKWLRQIIKLEEYWLPPFVLQLMGEYVLEIISFLADNEDSLKKEPYIRFIRENPEFDFRTTQRILSYWDAYYRWRIPRYKEYLSYKLAQNIGLWRNQAVGKA